MDPEKAQNHVVALVKALTLWGDQLQVQDMFAGNCFGFGPVFKKLLQQLEPDAAGPAMSMDADPFASSLGLEARDTAETKDELELGNLKLALCVIPEKKLDEAQQMQLHTGLTGQNEQSASSCGQLKEEVRSALEVWDPACC